MTDKNIDWSVEKNSSGDYDLVFVDGKIKEIETFDTAILMTMYEEQRASESEQPIPELRRGWWGNELSPIEGFEIGSKLWLLDQARATQNNANRAVAFARNGFQWFIEDGLLQDVQVSSVLDNDTIKLAINLIRNDDSVDSILFDLWDNTVRNTTINS